MSKIIFGKTEAPKKGRRRKVDEPKPITQLAISGGELNHRTLIDYKLCKECAKKVPSGIYKPSDFFPYICDPCKQGYVDISRKKFTIGALANIKKA